MAGRRQIARISIATRRAPRDRARARARKEAIPDPELLRLSLGGVGLGSWRTHQRTIFLELILASERCFHRIFVIAFVADCSSCAEAKIDSAKLQRFGLTSFWEIILIALTPSPHSIIPTRFIG
jgi:hypothetical protein